MDLKAVVRQHQLKFCFTLLLILLEAGLSLLFPLFIGYSIDDAVAGSYYGAIQLGILGVAVLVVGVGRRLYDSRFYAKLYQQLGGKIVSNIREDGSSVKSARLGMLSELIAFLENLLPELINSVIGLVGVIVIIATLNSIVFWGSLIVTVLVFLLYGLSSGKTTAFNRASNDELEKQVDILAKNDEVRLSAHLEQMMKWNIKLSDLEAFNFSVSWLILMMFLVASIIVSADLEMVKYGALFSLIMYVFQYLENVINLPLFYQSWLRLREILDRLISVKI